MIKCNFTEGACPEKWEVCCFLCPNRKTCGAACPDEPDGCENAVFVPEAGGDVAAFENKAAAIMQTIADISRKKAVLDAQDKEMRSQLETAMRAYGIDKFENDIVSLTYVNASVRSTVDSKKLLAKYPNAYNDCLKESPVKATVRIKVKE